MAIALSRMEPELNRSSAELHFLSGIVNNERIQQPYHVHSYHERRLGIQLPEPEDVEVAERDIEVTHSQIPHLNGANPLSLASLYRQSLAEDIDGGVRV